MNTTDTCRLFYARLIAALSPEAGPRIVDAFATVRREHFLGPGPWHIPVARGYISSETDDPAIVYQDMNIGLLPALGINNGQPSLHAHCLGAIAPKLGEHVLHIGSGSGYYTAILSHLVGMRGQVHAYEINAELAKRATANLADHANVFVHAESGAQSLPSADVIYVSAGTTDVPSSWLDALTIGGRLVVPLTPDQGAGFMLLVTRTAQATYAARSLSTAYFVPCIGVRNKEASDALLAAVSARDPGAISSLRRTGSPDNSAWCVWRSWWLSVAE